MRDDIAHAPDLFNGTPVVTEWPAKLRSARTTLDRAKDDLQQLDKLTDKDRAERLLRDERSLRESALHDSEAVEEDATKWLDFQKNIPHYLEAMQREYEDVHNADLTAVTQTVTKAEQDWPAKKDVLDGRLTALRQSSEAAESQWRATESARRDAAAGRASGAEVATLIQANEVLKADARNLTAGADELTAQCGQLYDAWDRILVDLDVSHRAFDTVYSEKLKTVHYEEVRKSRATNGGWMFHPPRTGRLRTISGWRSPTRTPVCSIPKRRRRPSRRDSPTSQRLSRAEPVWLLGPLGRRQRLDLAARISGHARAVMGPQLSPDLRQRIQRL